MIHSRALLFAAALGAAASLPAQLAGGYFVGPSGSFPNIAAAIAALTSQGVVAPVTFVVTANDSGPWTIPSFPGQGPANPVVFDGLGTVTIGGQPALTLNGCASVTFQGFSGTFAATPSAFVVNAGTADCTFRNCSLLGTVATSGQALFSAAGGSGLLIEDCVFGGGYESIYVQVGASGTVIRRNKIQAGGFWIMRLAGPNTLLENNFITGTSNYGISAGVSGTGGSATAQNLKIRHNSIYINHPTTGNQYCSLRWYAAAANNTEVVNNIFFDQYPGPPSGTSQPFNMWCSSSLRPTLMNYNCLWSNLAGYFPVYASANQTFASWQALGFDVNSIQADPLYVAPGTTTAADLRIGVGSPCATAGTFLISTLFDYFMMPRTPPVSIGAHEQDGSTLASYTIYGLGCTGTPGVPTNVATGLPQLGTTMTITFGNLPAPELAVAIFGFSNVTSGFGPLPLNLATFGAPNCFARASADATTFLLGSAGSASLQMATPNLPGLIGLTYYTQALVIDPPVNTLGVTMSDAAAAVVGL
ncbi:MAG: right-handed parallel beta-helix repeat-containing protein [Planctomycetes bacterium]|nr:right-handed parallel beta-helix repeat-containing protein [Planctomycetota bacterium]